MSDPSLSRADGWEPGPAELARPFDPQVGTAYAVAVRTESLGHEHASTTVLTYRLRRVDPRGFELPPLSVEMRGAVLKGTVADGDLIRLPAPAPIGGALQLSTVHNLTTNAPVTTKSSNVPAWVGITVLSILLVGIVLIVAIFVLGFLAVGGS